MSIGRYYVKIGTTVLPRVRDFILQKTPRNETRVESFSGGLCVDRAALKYSIRLRIPLLSHAELITIQTAAENITNTVDFYDGTTAVQKTMIVNVPERPQPIYYKNNRSQGVYYQNLIVEMEEV